MNVPSTAPSVQRGSFLSKFPLRNRSYANGIEISIKAESCDGEIIVGIDFTPSFELPMNDLVLWCAKNLYLYDFELTLSDGHEAIGSSATLWNFF